LAIDVACKNHNYIELLKCFLQKNIVFIVFFIDAVELCF